ncbi:MAG: helix-turn-helix domain-containing protein [Pyrinomonadaceae bacterium]|nr:helix-turn-helix domain-containing protein [Pyrinomonadaceae bacterium]
MIVFTSMFKGYLTTNEVGKKLGVTVGRIRQMIADGQLPATKIGRDNFIRESDLALVKNRKVGRPKGYSPKNKNTN